MRDALLQGAGDLAEQALVLAAAARSLEPMHAV